MKLFRLNKDYTIICEALNTRNGFKHEATLCWNNGNEIETAKICYINRTWERYNYQSVLKSLIGKTKRLTDKEKTRFTNKLDKEN